MNNDLIHAQNLHGAPQPRQDLVHDIGAHLIHIALCAIECLVPRPDESEGGRVERVLQVGGRGKRRRLARVELEDHGRDERVARVDEGRDCAKGQGGREAVGELWRLPDLPFPGL